MSENVYVYLLQFGAGEQIAHKIGWSQDPGKRLLQVSNRRDGVVVHAFPTADWVALEQAMHRRFAASCISGEWFRLTEQDVALFKTVERADSVEDLPPALRPTGSEPKRRPHLAAAEIEELGLSGRTTAEEAALRPRPELAPLNINVPRAIRNKMMTLAANSRRTLAMEVRIALEEHVARSPRIIPLPTP